jgi:hypothetical protein
MIRRTLWAACLGLALTMWAPLARAQEGELDQLDPTELADDLQRMGMTELLEELVRRSEGGEDVQARRMLAKATLARASSPQTPPSRRDELLASAIATLREVAEASKPKTRGDYKALEEHYADRLELIRAIGRVRIEPEAQRLMFLSGSRLDRQAVATHAGQASELVDDLSADLETTIADLQELGLKGIMKMGRFRDELQRQLNYHGGWIRFYHGMALVADGNDAVRRERRRELQQAIVSLSPFLDDPGSGVQDWAVLVTGMARREKGEHERAHELLARALNGERSSGDVRAQAAFQLSRNHTEWGDWLLDRAKVLREGGQVGEADGAVKEAEKNFQAARKQADEFVRVYREVRGDSPAARAFADMYKTLLVSHAWDTWALATDDEARRVELREKSQQALMGFLERSEDPAVQRYFLQLVAGKFRGRSDWDQLPAVVVYAVGAKEFIEAYAEPADSPERKAGMEKALELAEKVLARERSLASAVIPQARKLRADAMQILGKDPSLAARNYLDAARELLAKDADDPQALISASNACKVYRRAVAESPSPKLREEFVGALRFLLSAKDGAWARREPRWWFDLGWQLERLGRSDEAIEAYRNVDPARPEYMQARYRALNVRLAGVRAGKGGQADARALARDFTTFAGDARKRMPATDDPKRKRDLRDWGAEAEFRAAQVLAEHADDTPQALALMDRLRNEPAWQGSEVIQWAGAYRIQKLVEAERVDEAIREVEAYRSEYGDEEARGLIREVIRVVRRQIRRLQQQRGDARKLADLRAVYYRFARTLYEQSEGASDARRYAMKQMLADATLERGWALQDNEPPKAREAFQDALKLFGELDKTDAAQREKRKEAIRSEFDRKLSTVRSAEGNVSRTTALAEQHLASLSEMGIRPETIRTSVPLEDGIKEVRGTTDPDVQARLGAELSSRLVRFLEEVRQRRLSMVEVDGANLLGLARAHAALGNSEEARDLYATMVQGMPRGSEQYWQVQYEYIALLAKVHEDDPEVRGKLVTKIKQLGYVDPQMGGMKLRFDRLRRLLER